MGNYLGFSRPKVGDALPDLHRTDHKPVDESGSDSSQYESCIETEYELDSSRPSTSRSSEGTMGYLSMNEISVNNLSWTTTLNNNVVAPKHSNGMKYHYKSRTNHEDKLQSTCTDGQSTLIEESLMEDLTASSSDENLQDTTQSKGTEGCPKHKITKKSKFKSSKSKSPCHVTPNNDSSFLTAGSVSTNSFSSVFTTNPAGGDAFCNATDRTASLSTAWEIDFESDKERSGPPKKLKQRLKKKNRTKSHSRPKTPLLWGLTNEIIAERKMLDLRRWHCMSRPQYKRSCGISSVVSVWNYLYSTIGTGSLPPITQEEALHFLGFKPPFGEIRFGPFTGNATLMRWFRRLNEHYGVRGRAYYLYKPKGRLQTRFMTDETALEQLQNGLAGEEMGFIYHCLNHYFCPIGYEETPHKAAEAYFPRQNIVKNHEDDTSSDKLPTSTSFQTWILIGEQSCKHPPIHCKKWSDILQDLHCESPNYFNIRHIDRGIQQRKTKKKGGNLHCIVAFKKLQPVTTKKIFKSK